MKFTDPVPLDTTVPVKPLGAVLGVTIEPFVTPLNSDELPLICRSGPPVALIEALLAVSDVGKLESVTVAVKLTLPAVVGVPVMAPVEAFSVSPAGSDPELIENVYGGVPPAATSEEL